MPDNFSSPCGARLFCALNRRRRFPDRPSNFGHASGSASGCDRFQAAASARCLSAPGVAAARCGFDVHRSQQLSGSPKGLDRDVDQRGRAFHQRGRQPSVGNCVQVANRRRRQARRRGGGLSACAMGGSTWSVLVGAIRRSTSPRTGRSLSMSRGPRPRTKILATVR